MIEHHKRTKQIIIRVTSDEYEQLQNVCTRPRLASWIRDTCLNEKLQSQPVKMVDKHLLVWLGRLNGNINQIAKYINVQNKAGSQIDIVKVLAELALIRASLDSILEMQYVDKNLQK